MNEVTPTRSRLIALGEERRTMREGYAFLDEKCLLLAGEMLRTVRHVQILRRALIPLQQAAGAALQAALARHGLQGLQVVPPAPGQRAVKITTRAMLGVTLLDAQLAAGGETPAPAVWPSPEAEQCRRAFATLAAPLVELAALSATLARLLSEYRRTVRRVRALQDVLLPELESDLTDVAARLEDLEREEALAMRSRR